MKKTIIEAILKALTELGILTIEEASGMGSKIVLERPGDMAHGDYATNAAMVFGPRAKKA